METAVWSGCWVGYGTGGCKWRNGGSYHWEGARFWWGWGSVPNFLTSWRWVLRNIMEILGGDEFDVICIEEAACWQVVGQDIDQMIDNIGPMTEPWGTPFMASSIYNRIPLTFIWNVRHSLHFGTASQNTNNYDQYERLYTRENSALKSFWHPKKGFEFYHCKFCYNNAHMDKLISKLMAHV